MGTFSRIDAAALVLRFALGAMFIAHGLLKFLVFTLPGTAGFFASVGFPGWTAYIVAPFEVLGGVALLVGYRSNWVALASLPLLFGTLWVHSPNGWLFTNTNGGWEYPAVLVVLAVGVSLLGDGAVGVYRDRTASR